MHEAPKFTKEQAMYLQDAIINALTPAYTVLQMMDIALSGGQYQAILKLGQDAQKRLKDAALLLQKQLQLEDQVQPGPEHCGFRYTLEQLGPYKASCNHTDNPTHVCSAGLCPLDRYFGRPVVTAKPFCDEKPPTACEFQQNISGLSPFIFCSHPDAKEGAACPRKSTFINLDSPEKPEKEKEA